MAAATATNVLVMAHGYMRSERDGILPKPYRPKSVGEAKRLIAATFERNRWDDDSCRRYIGMKIGEEKDLAETSPEETRTILAAMQRSRMVIFAD